MFEPKPENEAMNDAIRAARGDALGFEKDEPTTEATTAATPRKGQLAGGPTGRMSGPPPDDGFEAANKAIRDGARRITSGKGLR